MQIRIVEKLAGTVIDGLGMGKYVDCRTEIRRAMSLGYIEEHGLGTVAVFLSPIRGQMRFCQVAVRLAEHSIVKKAGTGFTLQRACESMAALPCIQ